MNWMERLIGDESDNVQISTLVWASGFFFVLSVGVWLFL